MEVSSHFQQFLSDDGLATKVRVITSAIQSRQEKGLKNDPLQRILSEEETVRVFPKVPYDLYLNVVLCEEYVL